MIERLLLVIDLLAKRMLGSRLGGELLLQILDFGRFLFNGATQIPQRIALRTELSLLFVLGRL